MKFLAWIADHAVIIASIATLVAVLIKFEHRLPKRLNQWLFHIDLTILISSTLLGALKDHLDGEWQNQIEQRTATISKQLADEHDKYVALENKTEKIYEQTKDRNIDQFARSQFISNLIRQPKLRVTIKYLNGNNGEPFRFAAQVSEMLESAGYHLATSQPLAFLSTGDPVGIRIKVKDIDRPPEGVLALQRAFDLISFPAPVALDDTRQIPEGEIELFICRK